MASDDAGLAVLLPHECLQLLDTHLPKVGRLGIISDGRPDVLPVNYAVVGGEVAFRSGLGEKLAAAVDGAPVAFEVDAIDQAWQEGWSVVVHGHAQLLHDDTEIAELGQHLAQSWVPAEGAYHIKIVPDSITGRSIDIGRARRSDTPPWSRTRSSRLLGKGRPD